MSLLALLAAADAIQAEGPTDAKKTFALVLAAFIALGLANVAIRVIKWALKLVLSISALAAYAAMLTVVPLICLWGIAKVWQGLTGTEHETIGAHLDPARQGRADGEEDYGDSIFLDQSQP